MIETILCLGFYTICALVVIAVVAILDEWINP